MPKPLLVANWKMNGESPLLFQMHQVLLQQAYPKVDVVLCPPFVLLSQAQQLFADTDIAYGAQDLSNQDNGAYTGQISGQMLSQLACSYVIIGHSERRLYCGETDSIIAAKCARALEANLTPILCVGENAQQKQSQQTQAVVRAQVEAVVKSLNTNQLQRLVIAYEPVWAIGTGQAADPKIADEVHGLIRACVLQYDKTIASTMRILYGGSVNADNIREFLLQTNIDGALVGGAALKPEIWLKMVQTANEMIK